MSDPQNQQSQQTQPQRQRKPSETLRSAEPIRFGRNGIILIELRRVLDPQRPSEPYIRLSRGDEFRGGDVRIRSSVTMPNNPDVIAATVTAILAMSTPRNGPVIRVDGPTQQPLPTA